MADLTDAQRRAFRSIADHLVPPAEGMPAASEVGVADAGVDRILALRPEVAEPLRRALDAVAGLDVEAAVQTLNESDPRGFGAVALAASSAYYMSPAVHAALGYPGQRSRPVTPEEEGDYLADDLLQVVIDRGPIYRPTPR